MKELNERERLTVPADNMQKYENYKEQFKRLKRALANGFNLEAVFIEYAIIEDRTESILRHAGAYAAYLKKRGRYSATIESKVKYIVKLAENKSGLLHRYFSDSLLSDILAWKDERNRLIHALLKQVLTTEELIELAQTGERLTKELRTRTNNYKRAVERQPERANP